MAKIKTKITLKEIKEQIILPALTKTSFRYRVLTSTGAYEKAYRANNLRVGTITALIQTTESEIMVLGGGLNATAINASIRFLVPVNDVNDVDGSYSIIEQFREEITEALSMNGKLTLVLNAGGGVGVEKTFIGGISTSFPIGGELDIRQSLGNSFEFVCYMEFAYMQNAVNASDVQFYLDGDTTPIPYTQYSLSRKNTLTGNLYSSAENEESQTYAENSVFGVDLSMPALSSSSGVTGAAINAYIMRTSSANTPHTITISRDNNTYTQTVIFGEVVEAGQGAENLSWQLSFVPYLIAEDETENEIEG